MSLLLLLRTAEVRPEESPRLGVLRGYLPDYYDGVPQVEGILGVAALEIDRLEAFLEQLRLAPFPTQLTDDEDLLSMWEAHLGLAHSPEQSVSQRRNMILGHLRGRYVRAGSQWEAAVTMALGTSNWSYEDQRPSVNRITIYIPYGETSFTGAQVRALVRKITPAHILIDYGAAEGFLVGQSAVGDVI